jgi:flagellar hook assembly protein FlgD
MLTMSILLVAFSMTSAVIWEMSSEPFTVGIAKGRQMVTQRSDLRYRAIHGTMTFHYNIPSGEKNATLTIYNLSGHLIKKFDLKQGTTSTNWPIAQAGVSNGIYMAALKGGAIEKRITISIIK